MISNLASGFLFGFGFGLGAVACLTLHDTVDGWLWSRKRGRAPRDGEWRL